MKDLEIILDGLDRINRKLEKILETQKGEPVCEICGSDLGHFVNCPNGIAFTNKYMAPPKKTHKEITNG